MVWREREGGRGRVVLVFLTLLDNADLMVSCCVCVCVCVYMCVRCFNLRVSLIHGSQAVLCTSHFIFRRALCSMSNFHVSSLIP